AYGDEGGNITLIAAGDIITAGIYANGISSTGNITLTAGGMIDTSAVFFNGGVNEGGLISATSGNLDGNITLEAGTTIIAGDINVSGGDIILIGDEIDFTGGVDGTILVTSELGDLVIEPATASQDIVIGASFDLGANVLDVTATELNGFSGFASIMIGQPDGTGIIGLSPMPLDEIIIFNFPLEILGGSELLAPSDVNTTFTITGTDSGNVTSNGFINSIPFTSIENLSGSGGDDTFSFTNNATLSGTIDGSDGTDTLDYSAYTSPLTVNLAALGGSNIEQVQGTSNATSTLIANNTANTWTITGSNSGTVNGLTFIDFSNLTGGNSDDTFQFNNPATISNNINGGAGNLTLIGDELNFTGTISGTGTVTLQPLTSSQEIQLGGGDSGNSGILDLTAPELNSLQNTFTSITIGGTTSSGAITLADDITFQTPVTLQAPVGSGSINTTAGTITGEGNATITLLANQDIITGDIINRDRALTLTSRNGAISTGNLTAGALTLTTNGGDISVNSSNPTVLSGSGVIQTRGGTITLNTTDLEGGGVTLNTSNPTGEGGDIYLNAKSGRVAIANLNSSGLTGGDIVVQAELEITTGAINTSGNLGDGGHVTLDPIGDIQVTSINAQGGIDGT
ncbi:MAG: hypothetical protein RLP02_25895, partial [Coleofasciculus sp. C2-GNP5-27]